ncbi:MAG: hypothetical protein ACR2NA_05885 [Solirubrobacterales bacterium]
MSVLAVMPAPATLLEALPLALLPEGAAFYAGLMAFGFLVGVYGHVIKVQALVILGIVLIFAAVVAFPIVARVFDGGSAIPPG